MYNKQYMGKKLTTQGIIDKFKSIHGSTYDYSLVDYQGDSKKVKIICRTHGVFEQQPGAHGRQKQGCPKCSNIKVGKAQQIGNSEFIKRVEKVFGKDAFDYSKLDYQGAHKEVTLVCKKCGNVETKPPSVWYLGFGCLNCKPKQRNPKQVTKEQFIERAKRIHGSRYDYSKIVYTTLYDEVEIICPKHGSFYQKPTVHIHAKSNCPECNTTKGEEAISIWLNNKGIKYIFQHKVQIDNSYHYYDFYLPEHNIIIEFNGKQHYEPIKFFGGQNMFEYLQSRDKIKEQYCLNNQIRLLIFSYKELNQIENLLVKTLNV
jgi:very-short-patch-repair endonuclease